MSRIVRTPVARKPYSCAGLCSGEIAPGTRYVAVVYPPWTHVQEDREDPPTALGEWITERYHLGCYP